MINFHLTLFQVSWNRWIWQVLRWGYLRMCWLRNPLVQIIYEVQLRVWLASILWRISWSHKTDGTILSSIPSCLTRNRCLSTPLLIPCPDADGGDISSLNTLGGSWWEASWDHMCCLWRTSGACVQRGGVQHADWWATLRQQYLPQVRSGLWRRG